MNVRIEYTQEEKKEVIIRCNKIDKEVLRVKELIELYHEKLSGSMNGEIHFFIPEKVYYFESVDNRVFAYMEENILSVSESLERLEERLGPRGFFRCSKSMLLNFHYIEKFKSAIGHRITATLSNGEEVIVSRHYAKVLRGYLKEEIHEKQN